MDQLSIAQIRELWKQYRDEEHATNFPDQEGWNAYKQLFMNFPNFPDWIENKLPKPTRVKIIGPISDKGLQHLIGQEGILLDQSERYYKVKLDSPEPNIMHTYIHKENIKVID